MKTYCINPDCNQHLKPVDDQIGNELPCGCYCGRATGLAAESTLAHHCRIEGRDEPETEVGDLVADLGWALVFSHGLTRGDALKALESGLAHFRAESTPAGDAEGDDDTACDVCGEPADDGEGYDGLCGNCADVREAVEEDAPPAALTTPPSLPPSVLDPNVLYHGDNERLFCGDLRCAGMSAHFTGREISGQPVERVTRDDRLQWDALGTPDNPAPPMACEGCGKTGL